MEYAVADSRLEFVREPSVEEERDLTYKVSARPHTARLSRTAEEKTESKYMDESEGHDQASSLDNANVGEQAVIDRSVLAVDDVVMAHFRGGPVLYSGRVFAINKDSTYGIVYADGFKEYAVPLDRIVKDSGESKMADVANTEIDIAQNIL